MMHHGPPMAAHHPHIHQGVGRNSPYYPTFLQTEVRIIELNRRLQCRPALRHPVNPLPSHYDENAWWERFACEFFEDDATLTLRTHEDKPVEYTIGRTLIPRFFRTYFDGGVTDLSINLRNPKEAYMHPHMITLDCDQAFIITNNTFRHPAAATNQGVVVHTEGHLVLDFVSNNFEPPLFIKSWRFYTRSSREYIDRSILTTMGLPNTFLAEPVTRHGLTKSTIAYLKMCMIMEPMQDLMFQHKQTKLDPRSCLRKLLFDRYKFRSGDDNRTATNKRRKRKSSAVPAIAGATTNKKTKGNVNNSIANSGLNNNIMVSPSGGPPGYSLASQDVMVVGEPSMMGGDFGDDNERMITRLENTQYDPNAFTPSNVDELESMAAIVPNDNGINSSNNLDSNIENHAMSPSLLHRQQPPSQPVQQPQQLTSQQTSPPQQPAQLPPQQQSSQTISSPNNNIEQGLLAPPTDEPQHQPQSPSSQQQQQQQQEPQVLMEPTSDLTEDIASSQESQPDMSEQQQQELENHSQPLPQQQSPTSQNDKVDQLSQVSTNRSPLQEEQAYDQDHGHLVDGGPKQQGIVEDQNKLNSIMESANGSNPIIGMNSVEPAENHNANSVQTINDESNSNSQLACSTANPKSTIEQQQPVDNGVA